MKRNMIIRSALFAALWSAQTALAWYDPSTARWLTRDPIREPGFELLHQKGSPGSQDSNAYRFVRNDPLDHQDAFGLQVSVASPGAGQAACQLLTATGATIAAALGSVPVGATVLGAAVVGTVAVVTYTICHPTPWPRTWCPSRVNTVPISVKSPEPELCPKEVDELLPNGTRHCEFWCRKSGIRINKYGSECDPSSIKYPEIHPGTQPVPPYPPAPPIHP